MNSLSLVREYVEAIYQAQTTCQTGFCGRDMNASLKNNVDNSR